jgi:hypothetical protein
VSWVRESPTFWRAQGEEERRRFFDKIVSLPPRLPGAPGEA